ncbi:MAG: restriction endonuclease subunit S [Chlorobium sp.]
MQSKPYTKYKPSGIEWLGDVPEHWEVKKLKQTMSLITKKSNAETQNVALENIESWSGKYIPSDTEFDGDGVTFQVGDILFGKLRPYLAKAYLAEFHGAAVGDFHVMRPIMMHLHGRYILYLILNKEVISLIDGSTFGAKMPRVNWEFMANIPIPLPTLPEQQAIADFLDRETGHIDALIAKKKSLLSLLAEQRTALISRAVTKGLNPSVKLKPSGVEWLGDVPEHWDVKKLKHVTNFFGRIGFRGYTTDDLVAEGDGAITLSPSNMKKGELNLEKCTYISWEKYYESPEIMIKRNDVVIVKTGSTFGKISFVRDIDHPITLNPQIAVFKNVRCNSRFFFFYVTAPYIQDQISLSNTGSTIPTMTQQTILSYAIPLPPLPEQQAIADFLDCETAKIDTLSAKVQTAIERLKEYRTALISAAVTGKIDVREAV